GGSVSGWGVALCDAGDLPDLHRSWKLAVAPFVEPDGRSNRWVACCSVRPPVRLAAYRTFSGGFGGHLPRRSRLLSARGAPHGRHHLNVTHGPAIDLCR